MIALLIDLAILCIVFGLIYWVVQQLPLPEPFRKIALVVVLVLFLVLVLGVAFGGVSMPRLGLRG